MTAVDTEEVAEEHPVLIFGMTPVGRLAADALLASLEQPRFSWGRNNLVSATETRSAYVAALRAADAHNFAPLMAFVRT